MTDSKWERLQSLFEQAVILTSPEREQFLLTACGDDSVLRADVEALLEADSRNDSWFGSAPELGGVANVDSRLIGTSVGTWRLLEHIGVGGMGSVFLAQRMDGSFEQRAALKIVKKGMDTDEVVQRFRQERQILARLDHPNIARFLDGGVTDDGRPFFAMELVDGLPITQYCDNNRLNFDERLVHRPQLSPHYLRGSQSNSV